MNASRALLFSLLCTACSPTPQAEEPPAEAPPAESAAPSAVPVGAVSAALAEARAVASIETPLEIQTHTLDAKVKSITPFGEKATNVYIVDADPRFVIELELFGVAPAMADDPPGSGLVAGKTVAFAVHSPSRVFKTDGDMTGKRMHFSVTRTRKTNKVEIGQLEVE